MTAQGKYHSAPGHVIHIMMPLEDFTVVNSQHNCMWQSWIKLIHVSDVKAETEWPTRALEQDVSTGVLLTFEARSFCAVGSCPVHCRMIKSVPALMVLAYQASRYTDFGSKAILLHHPVPNGRNQKTHLKP